MLYVMFSWYWSCTSEVENFQIFSIYFYYFAIFSPWGMVWAFICKMLNFTYPRMLCAKFGWNWPSSFKKRILKKFQYNFTISLLSPLWGWRGPSFEQTWIPYTRICIVPSLVENGQVVLKKKIFKNIFNIILQFYYYLPLVKSVVIHFNKLESPTPKDALCQVWF